MSSDNVLVITEDKNGQFTVEERFYSGRKIESLGTFRNLREATAAATEYLKSNIVEYGMEIRLYEGDRGPEKLMPIP